MRVDSYRNHMPPTRLNVLAVLPFQVLRVWIVREVPCGEVWSFHQQLAQVSTEMSAQVPTSTCRADAADKRGKGHEMLTKMILIFVVVPFVELTLLLKLSTVMGVKWTLGLIIFTGILGGALARWQGLRTLTKLRDQISNNQFPTEALADGGMILVAGALLLTPGILTDIVGFSLLMPFCRPFYRQILMRWAKNNVTVTGVHVHGSGRAASPRHDDRMDNAGANPDVIDAEAVTRSDGH